ncbi:MAG: hypothetical protein WCK34_16155 [Bacteroidota bacterium]
MKILPVLFIYLFLFLFCESKVYSQTPKYAVEFSETTRNNEMSKPGDKYSSPYFFTQPINSLIFSGSDTSADDSNYIGKNYEGGRIFWLDATGQHGLVAAAADQSRQGIAWDPGQTGVTGADGDGLFAGAPNTKKIVGITGNKLQYAAKLCGDLSVTINNIVYNDWYLPSRFELNLLFRQRTLVGGFNTTGGIYWSSTEAKIKPATRAWEQEFKFGSQHEDDKDLKDQVRCIRKF